LKENRRLSDLRNQAGLSQEELANAVGVSQSMIARIESGDRDPGTEIKIKLALYFRVSVEWLFFASLYAQRECDVQDPTGTDDAI